MDDRRLGMAVRARRHQRGWRLADLAAAANVSATTCSEVERGMAASMAVRMVRAVAEAVDLPLGWDIGWQRQVVDRLLDADHSALAGHVAHRLESWGWQVRAEVSFNWYGDRGRIDLLAFHPVHATLLVIEIKTVLVDLQDLLGGLDVKARIAPRVARDLGWDIRATVPVILIAEGTTVRRHLAAMGGLLGRYALRGHAAVRWLREPAVASAPSGVLILSKWPSNAGSDARRAGRRRVRHRGPGSRSGGNAPPGGQAPNPA